MNEVEYWDCQARMSKNGLYEVLYAVIMLNGAVTDSLAIGCQQFTKHQNSYNYVDLRIRLPKGQKEAFEKMSGISLIEPCKISVN